MKQYKVQITDKVLADMEEIYNYIAIQLQAPENAIGQYNRIAKKIIPKVNESAEFLEIASDFGDPLELFEKHCIMHTIGEQQNYQSFLESWRFEIKRKSVCNR